MEKTCEFCGAPRPIVYCQADGAFLCLSCDAKVHSANALSGRHSRTLLCDSCRYNQAYVRCLDHLMLLCRGCDSRLHKLLPQHKKLMINSFTGCPSAKHFAALWGFKANELNDFSTRSHLGSESSMFNDMFSLELKSTGSAVESTSDISQPGIGSSNSNNRYKTSNDQKEQNNCLIMQQILDLKKLQLTDDDDNQSPLLHRHDEFVTPSSMYGTSGKHNEGLDQQLKELDYLANNPQNMNNSNQVTKGERYPSSTSQLDHFPGSSSVADPLCQGKDPVDNSQFWTQNMQDLGVCEEQGSFDDFNIPEVDATFRNFEDLFTGDEGLTQALLEDDDLMWSEIEKDVSVASSVYANKDANLSGRNTNQLSRSFQNSQYLIRSSCSASFSPSRLSAESSGSEFLDSGHSGSFARGEPSDFMDEIHGTNMDRAECTMKIPKERKKTRLHGRQTQLSPRKARADMHKRTKSRCLKVEGYESDAANVTKSY